MRKTLFSAKSTTLLVTFVLSVVSLIISCSTPNVPVKPETISANVFPKYGYQKLDNKLQISTAECFSCKDLRYIRFQIAQHYIPQGTQKGIAEMTMDFIIHDLENVESATSSEFGIDIAVDAVHYNAVLKDLSDRLNEPNFDQKHFEHVKSRAVSFLELDLEDPKYQAKELKKSINFKDNHPYSESARLENLRNITLDDLNRFYANNITPNNAIISVVGTFTDLKIEADRVGAIFNTWEGSPAQQYTIPSQKSNQIFDIYIMPTKAGIKDVYNIYSYPINFRPGNSDIHLVNILSEALYSKDKGLISNTLEELGARNLEVHFEPNPVTATLEFTYFTDVDRTGIVLDSLINMLKSYRSIDLDSSLITDARNRYIQSFQRKLSNPLFIQDIRTEQLIYGQSDAKARDIIYSTEDLNGEKLKIMHRKYFIPERALHLSVGDVDKLKEQLIFIDENKKLDYLDSEGTPIEIVDQEIPKDITAHDVIDGYLEAIGGRNKVLGITDLAKLSTALVMGNPAKWSTYYQNGNRFAVKMNIEETILFEEKYDGEEFYVLSQNIERKVRQGDKEYDEKLESLLPIEQAHYDKPKWDVTLEGLEYVDREKCYKVKVVSPTGRTKYQYYRADDFLMIQQLTQTEDKNGQKGKILQTYEDYREVEGIKFPFGTVVRGVGPAPIVSSMDTILVNKVIDPSVFKIENRN